MRALVVLGLSILCTASAQVDKPAEPLSEKPPLLNTGKPMVVDYLCAEEDIRSAGLSCTNEDPCPVFLDLESVESVGNRIFAAGNIHSSTATLYSILLATGDSGMTWREPYERIPAAGLDRIQFIDFENGWIGGEVQRPLPRDPFLLVTSDGGRVWRPRPIFADPRFGSVLQFSFSSRTDGSVLIDRGGGGESGRYELYETPNAGETWMLRQVNERPIRIKPANAAGNSDWRVRADAVTKAYRIEHRIGGAWHGVAAFAVSIGACKPPELPAPPAEDATAPPNRSR